MTQGSRARSSDVELLPASEFLPPDGWQALAERAPADRDALRGGRSPGSSRATSAEAAETWAALLTAGPAADTCRRTPTSC